MKPFLYRAGAAILIALGGFAAGFLMVHGERTDLKKQLATADSNCTSHTLTLQEKIASSARETALRDGIILVHRAKRDLKKANFGNAHDTLNTAKTRLEAAKTGAIESQQSAINKAIDGLSAAMAGITSQDNTVPDQLDEIVAGLEPT